MSTFINNDLTNGGRILIAKNYLGQKMKFTRIVMGDGYLPTGTPPREMTDVVNPVVNVKITKMKMNADGTVIIGGVFTNADISTEFFYRELALFAEGEDGTEVLYCYGNAGEFAERITPVGGSSIIEKAIDIVTAIGTTENVTATIVRTTAADEIAYDDRASKLGAGSIQEAVEILAAKSGEQLPSTIISPTEPTEHCEIWLKPMGQADTPDTPDDLEETPPPAQSLFYFLAHCYDKENKSFVPFMYMNAAQNVFMTPGGTETVADAILQLQKEKSTNDYTDADKSKLAGVAANANNYSHPTGDGNSHIPSTGTANNGKILKAGSTANSAAWGSVTFSEIASKPTTLAGYGITDAEPKRTLVTQDEAEAGTGTTVRGWTPQMVAIAAKAAAVDSKQRLGSFSWAQIEAISKAGNASSYFLIGDEKDITLTTNEVVTLQIYGFNHDDLTAGGKAGITFGFKNLLNSMRNMNSTNTNVNGFTGSEMYTWLNGDFYNSLPSDLKGLLKAVNKKTSAGNKSTTINTNSMRVFLFSYVETHGTTAATYKDEGTQYPIFTDNASRIKFRSIYPTAWWSRSPYATSDSAFCQIYGDGTQGPIAANLNEAVLAGFCI